MTTKKKKIEQHVNAEGKKIKRQFGVPEELYYKMVDENTRIKREGKRETTEQTMLNLMQDGLEYRKMQTAKKDNV